MTTLESLESRVLFHAGDFDPALNHGAMAAAGIGGPGSVPTALAVLPDGGMLVAGSGYTNTHDRTAPTELVVVKFNFDGTFDDSFGANGEITATPRGMIAADQIALTPDGGFLILGGKTGTPMVLKFTAAGKVDTTFGKNGLLQLGSITDLGTLAVDSAGRIILPGRIDNAGVVRRYLANGAIDTNFADNGDYRIEPGSAAAPNQFHQIRISAAAVDSKDRIVFSGFDSLLQADVETGPQTIALTDLVNRLDDSGAVDTSFDTTGLPSLKAAGKGDFEVARILPNGNIMLEALAMAELNPDGSVNTDYGDNGISPISKESGAPGIADDGSAVIPLDAVDVSGVNPVADFSVRRVLPNGKLDRAFGTNGKVLLTRSVQGTTIPTSIAIAPDGTIVAAGQTGMLSASGADESRNFGVARMFSGEGPAVQLVPRTLRTSSRYLSFNVLIRDDDGVDTSTLDDSDLKLFDADGNTRKIRFLNETDVNGGDQYIRATYRIIGPNSSPWTSAANGTYEVRLQRKQIADASANSAAAQVLGTVRVKIA